MPAEEYTPEFKEDESKDNSELEPIVEPVVEPVKTDNIPEPSLTQKLEELKHGKKLDIKLEELFPHESMRKGQDELINDFDKACSEKKVLIAHAPTGMGKTASALCVALKHALKENKVVFFLTNRHTQHQIAVNTLKQIQHKTKHELLCVDLIGKRWMCNQDVANLFGNEFNEYCKSVVEKGECEFYTHVKQKKEITVEAKLRLSKLKVRGPLHNEELTTECKAQNLCSYEMALLLAKDARILIGDYNYLFSSYAAKTVLQKMDKEVQDIILILDEGHNLPGRVTDMLSNMLTTNMLKNGIYEAKKFRFNGLLGWLADLNAVLNELAQFSDLNEREKKVSKEEFIFKLQQRLNYDQFLEELEFAADEVRKKRHKSYLGGIHGFLDMWKKGEEQGFVRYISQRRGRYGEVIGLNYSCLDPSLVTRDVFNNIHAGIIMSGTLKPTHMYKNVLGIDSGIEKEYVSPFPSENKLSIIIPETSTKYTMRNETMFKKIAEKCSDLCGLIPGNVALFFPSYDLRDNIAKFIITPKKLFWEKSEMNKEEKDVFLEQFKAEKSLGGVLLGVAGANFAEGIDLPGDLLNGVVVVGLPLAKPDLLTREIINYYDQKFSRGWNYGYIYPAMNKCFQSAGRCIRSETDKGVVIYLDDRFVGEQYYCCFSREGLIVSKDYRKLLGEFFENRNASDC